MKNNNIKFYLLLVIMGVCLIPIFLLYNTHHKMISVDIEKVSASIIANFYNVEKDESDILYTDFNIDKEKNMISEYVYYHPLDTMLVEEYLVIKLSDMSDASYIKKAIDRHIESRKNDFVSYGVDQYSTLQNAKIYEYSPYIIYVVHKDIKKIDSMIRESFR